MITKTNIWILFLFLNETLLQCHLHTFSVHPCETSSRLRNAILTNFYIIEQWNQPISSQTNLTELWIKGRDAEHMRELHFSIPTTHFNIQRTICVEGSLSRRLQSLLSLEDQNRRALPLSDISKNELSLYLCGIFGNSRTLLLYSNSNGFSQAALLFLVPLLLQKKQIMPVNTHFYWYTMTSGSSTLSITADR